jgi:hypothetical protein
VADSPVLDTSAEGDDGGFFMVGFLYAQNFIVQSGGASQVDSNQRMLA